MSETPSLRNRFRLAPEPPDDAPSVERKLRNFRYVVGAVDDDALRVWADLWEQLKSGVTPAGMVLPQMEDGFKPSCGWAEFFEKFWLLKHYLDYIHGLCQKTT